jgi:hypothetical protein
MNKLGIPSANNFVPLTDGSAMPAGTIISYAGSIAAFTSISSDGTTLIVKDGWAVCNGASILQTTYSQLFTRIATTWNTCRNQGTGSNYSAPTTTYFRIPDLRGVFLRSEGTSTGYSATTLGATQDDATSKNGLTASAGASGVSGSVGGSDGTHTHGFDYTDRYIVMPGSGYGSGTAFALSPLVNIATNTSGSGHGHNHSLTASAQAITVGAGDAETRPVNVGVYYLIKLYDNLAAVDVYIPSASAGVSGLVDTGVQSFAGVKTFNSAPVISDASGIAAATATAKGLISKESPYSGSALTLTYPGGGRNGNSFASGSMYVTRIGTGYFISIQGSMNIAAANARTTYLLSNTGFSWPAGTPALATMMTSGSMQNASGQGFPVHCYIETSSSLIRATFDWIYPTGSAANEATSVGCSFFIPVV